jgi:aminomethyltransferase
MPHLGLQGPRAKEALSSLCETDISGLRYFRFLPEQTSVGGVPCFLSRTGFGGELGYELFCTPKHADDLWDVAVSKMFARPFGVGVLESLRVEAGLVVLDYDYTAHERTPYDLSFDRFVALRSVRFLGSEALEQVSLDPPRRLKTLRIEGDTLPDYGVEVTRDGELVGTLTSPALSPRFGQIALAILETGVSADGEKVQVKVGDTTVPASVAPLAIYDPEKIRPRA